MRAYPYRPTEPLALEVGGKVMFQSERTAYTVRTVTEHFVLLTKQAPFRPRGENWYTIIFWERGWRGPWDYIGNGASTTTDEDCANVLAELEKAYADGKAHQAKYKQDFFDMSPGLSHRQSIYLDIDWYEAKQPSKRKHHRLHFKRVIKDDGTTVFEPGAVTT